jgi:4-alpha-glucanotransferase
MTRSLLALALVAGCATAASAQTVPPLATPPPLGADQTANLIFNAQMAISRAATQNSQAAAAAAANNYQQAIQNYRTGDFAGARAAALQALMNADRVAPQPIPTISPMSPTQYYTASASRPLAAAMGDTAHVDADAFVAAARGAVAACVNTHDPNTAQAETQLAAAEHADRAANYNAARAAAKNAVDLCAGAQRQSLSP